MTSFKKSSIPLSPGLAPLQPHPPSHLLPDQRSLLQYIHTYTLSHRQEAMFRQGLSSHTPPSRPSSLDEKSPDALDSESPPATSSTVGFFPDHTKRKLKARHIQLIGIGGTIGTALYVQIGRGLTQGGPGSLFIAFTFWCAVIACVNYSLAEMVTYIPVSSPFVRMAGRYVDDALGVAAGWNFFIFEAALIPFEIVACNIILRFWTDSIHVGWVVGVVLILYALMNFFAVRWYGESEFWLALGKVLLIVGLIIFTFITMLGGNPLRDRYGFRFWQNPGAFAEYIKTGTMGRFMGFLACLIQASFTIAGPDYVSMAAGEAATPRKVLPRAYNSVLTRLTLFFMLGSLCPGIVVPYNDPNLKNALSGSKPGAGASPYVIAMIRMNIQVLPHIVNALVLTSAFSAGNSYVYCASRCLYGLALEGKAPRFLTACTRRGVPYLCVGTVLGIGLLSFLQVTNSAAVVLSWFVSLVTASQLINFSIISVSFIFWRRILASQGIDPTDKTKHSLPYVSPTGVYGAYFALFFTFIMTFIGGYTVFLPGNWDVPNFLFSYMMVMVCPVLFVGWKYTKGTSGKWVRGEKEKVDLAWGGEKEVVDAYEREYVQPREDRWIVRLWDRIWG